MEDVDHQREPTGAGDSGEKERRRAKWHAAAEERKRQGLCRQCGKRLPSPGRRLCGVCAGKQRTAMSVKRQTRKARGLCPECGHRPVLSVGYCAPCRANRNRHIAACRRRLKQEVLAHYGGACACCGESTPEFLTIDHVNGGGVRHRRLLGLKGMDFYRWLKREGFPTGYQTLCFNCNCAKGARRRLSAPTCSRREWIGGASMKASPVANPQTPKGRTQGAAPYS